MTTAGSAPASIERVIDADGCEAVRPLVVDHARYERSSTVVPADWARRASALITDGRLELFAAVVDDLPVGYATLTVDIGTWSAAAFAHLDCLYVDEAHRGGGLGRQLVDAVIAHAHAHAHESGAGELRWQTPAWNSDAIRFYERLGAHRQTKERFTLPLSRCLQPA